MAYKKVLCFAGVVAVVVIVAIVIFLNVSGSPLICTWVLTDDVRGEEYSIAFRRNGTGTNEVSFVNLQGQMQTNTATFRWSYDGNILTMIVDGIGWTDTAIFNIIGSGRDAVLILDGERWYRQ